MALRNAFSRPSGAFRRGELDADGAGYAITEFAEVRESLATGKVAASNKVIFHGALLLRIVPAGTSSPAVATTAAAATPATPLAPSSDGGTVSLRFAPPDAPSPHCPAGQAILRADWNAASKVWFRVVAGGAWEDNGTSVTPEANGAVDGAASAASPASPEPTAEQLLGGATEWVRPGRDVTLARLHEPWGWYDLRFNNCQHFVGRAKADLLKTEAEANVKSGCPCAVS